jgi:CRP/FNR family transcriptional regulator/CRP/FNR family cyclic AMP-dependent transcriptional regulator
MEFVSRILDGTIAYDLKDALRSSVSPGYRVSRDEKIRHLEKVPILAECTQRQLRAVAALSKVVEMPAGSVLMRAGEPGDEFFMIIDGAAMVEISPRKRRRMGPGEFLGEMSLLDGEPRSATVRAETDIRLLVVVRRHFQGLLTEVPELTVKILGTLSRRIRQLEQPLDK